MNHYGAKDLADSLRRSTLEGFDFRRLFQSIMAEEQTSRSKAQIIAVLRDDGERWAKWLERQSDDFLAERLKSLPA